MAAKTDRAARTDKVQADNDRIERLAYEIYQARGKTAGRDQDDWFQAERELSASTSERPTGDERSTAQPRLVRLTSDASEGDTTGAPATSRRARVVNATD